MTNPNDLRPGQTLSLGQTGTTRTYVERSGDGRTLRWVRETPAGFVVFATRAYGGSV